MSPRRALLAAVALVYLAAHPAAAARPNTAPEMVFGAASFDGVSYSPVFAPQAARTIYLLEGKPSAVGVRRTQVYFWPLTERYLPDWEALNEELDGRLRITRGNTVIRDIEKRLFALVYPKGLAGAGELVVDDQARIRYAEFQRERQKYEEAIGEYYRQYERYVERLRKNRQSEERRPTEPRRAATLVSPPAEAFVIDLPVGKYQMTLIDSAGKAVVGSQRDLLVFGPRRQGIGYKVIPPSRWTDPMHSSAESQTIYTTGQSTLFLQPYPTQEFNELLYARLKDPQDKRASEGRWVWVAGEPDLSKPMRVGGITGGTKTVEAASYVVEQIEGSKLGYRINKHPAETSDGVERGFRAYEVAIPAGGEIQISLMCSESNSCSTSQRRIVVAAEKAGPIYGIACVPLLIGCGVMLHRRTHAGRARRSTVA